jgi:hypothetical protein
VTDRWRANPRLGVVSSADRVAIVVPDRPAQQPVILEGSAARLWHHLQRDPLGDLAATSGLAPADLEAFLERLTALGLGEPPA